MGRADLQAREPIERALKDQMRQGNGGLERIADDIAEVAVTLEAMTELRRRPIGLRVDENKHIQLLGLGPEWVEPFIADLLARNIAADGCADHTF
jgi:hypothetical protein